MPAHTCGGPPHSGPCVGPVMPAVCVWWGGCGEGSTCGPLGWRGCCNFSLDSPYMCSSFCNLWPPQVPSVGSVNPFHRISKPKGGWGTPNLLLVSEVETVPSDLSNLATSPLPPHALPRSLLPGLLW